MGWRLADAFRGSGLVGATPKSDGTAKRLAAIRRILDSGRRRFILTWGVGGAGVPLFVLMSLLPSLGLVSWLPESTERPVFYILTGAVLWLFAGYLLGLVIWRALEWWSDALARRL